jgi:hypothetical protein
VGGNKIDVRKTLAALLTAHEITLTKEIFCCAYGRTFSPHQKRAEKVCALLDSAYLSTGEVEGFPAAGANWTSESGLAFD